MKVQVLEDEKIRETVFARENMTCASDMELPYYSVDFFKPVCIYCGREGTTRQLNATELVYPKCNSCSSKPDVLRRKRKSVDEQDLQSGKKKKQTTL